MGRHQVQTRVRFARRKFKIHILKLKKIAVGIILKRESLRKRKYENV